MSASTEERSKDGYYMLCLIGCMLLGLGLSLAGGHMTVPQRYAVSCLGLVCLCLAWPRFKGVTLLIAFLGFFIGQTIM